MYPLSFLRCIYLKEWIKTILLEMKKVECIWCGAGDRYHWATSTGSQATGKYIVSSPPHVFLPHVFLPHVFFRYEALSNMSDITSIIIMSKHDAHLLPVVVFHCTPIADMCHHPCSLHLRQGPLSLTGPCHRSDKSSSKWQHPFQQPANGGAPPYYR